MTNITFWNILEPPKKPEPYCVDKHVQLIRTRLDGLSKVQYIEFVQLFREKLDELYTWDLWAVAYIVKDQTGFAGCGDSSFEDFRAAIICQGEDLFKLALEYPDELANTPNIELFKDAGDLNFTIPNHFSEISKDEHQILTKEEEIYIPHTLPTSPKGAPWDENDMKGLSVRFPKSIAKWGQP